MGGVVWLPKGQSHTLSGASEQTIEALRFELNGGQADSQRRRADLKTDPPGTLVGCDVTRT